MPRSCGWNKLFNNTSKKEEMLNLRMMGYSYTQLSRRYGVDHSTIIYHCKKNGVALKNRVREELYDLIKIGTSVEEISKRLGILKETINLYIKVYGSEGFERFSRRITKIGPIRRKPNVPKVIEIRHRISLPIPRTQMTKIDKKGVEWIQGVNGKWICVGRTEESIKEDLEKRKKKELEQKRLKMLKY